MNKMSSGIDPNCRVPIKGRGATTFSFDPRGTSTYLCRLGFKYSEELAIKAPCSIGLELFVRKINETFKFDQIECPQRQTLCDVYLKLVPLGTAIDGSISSSSRQKMVGSVHGRIFKHLVQELHLQRPLKLRITMTFKDPVNTTVATDDLTFMSDPRDKSWPKAFKFEKELEGGLWNIPSTETFVNYKLRVEFVGCPFIPSTKGLGINKRNWEGETGLITKEFLEKGAHCDFRLVSGNGEDRVQCHKVFLGGSSPFFDRMLQTNMKEGNLNECQLEGSTKEGLEALLKFLYYRNVEDALGSPALAFELLHLGQMYDIPQLEETMRQLILAKLDEWWDLEVAFELFLRPRCLEVDDKWQSLKRKAEHVLKIRSSEWTSDSNTLLNELWEKDPNAAKKLIRMISKQDAVD